MHANLLVPLACCVRRTRDQNLGARLQPRRADLMDAPASAEAEQLIAARRDIWVRKHVRARQIYRETIAGFNGAGVLMQSWPKLTVAGLGLVARQVDEPRDVSLGDQPGK